MSGRRNHGAFGDGPPATPSTPSRTRSQHVAAAQPRTTGGKFAAVAVPVPLTKQDVKRMDFAAIAVRFLAENVDSADPELLGQWVTGAKENADGVDELWARITDAVTHGKTTANE